LTCEQSADKLSNHGHFRDFDLVLRLYAAAVDYSPGGHRRFMDNTAKE
jgi:hypothetical protein